MKSLSRVVWSEGMYLGPHHFQAQSRYFEDTVRSCASMLWAFPYGMATCSIDTAALTNGTVSLLHASGILPDGLAFQMPDGDRLPEARNFSRLFPPTSRTLTVLLAISAHEQNGYNCASNEKDASSRSGEPVRYVCETRSITDETTGHDEKAVRLGRKNFRLVLDSEISKEMIHLPIARIMRSGSGEFVPDPTFIPPCLQIGASARLMALTGRLLEIMQEKSSSLTRGNGTGAQSFSTRDIASFWFLHTVNACISPLQHQYLSKRGHPEELFQEMLRLAGGLCTFALDSHPRMLPVYDHDNPDVCFEALDAQIRQHLELIIPTGYLTMSLTKTADYFYGGAITDERCIGRASWILGIRSSIGELDVARRVPELVKICSERFVGELVRRALPGLPLQHLATPPPAMPQTAETQYFVINRSGPFWDNIVQTRRVGIYIPGDIPDPEIELLAILES